MLRKPQKPPDGVKLKETPDMAAWRKEFDKMKTEEHLEKLAALGLDDEDLEEFKELESGKKSLEDEMAPNGVAEKPAAKKKGKK